MSILKFQTGNVDRALHLQKKLNTDAPVVVNRRVWRVICIREVPREKYEITLRSYAS